MSVDDRELIESRDLLDVKDARDSDISSTGSDVGDHPVPLPTSNASFTGAEKTLTGDETAASNAASSPPSERSPDPLPSSIHPDFSVQTSDDFLLVTDDDVGFYVNRDFLLEHSDFFRDFEEMDADIRKDNDAGEGRTQAVRRDMPGALSKGLRVVLLKVRQTKYLPDVYDWTRKIFRSRQKWKYDLEDLALAFRIANQYGFTRFSAQARWSIPKRSAWFQYLYAVFEADETVAKAIAKSTLRWDLTKCPQRLLPVLDKHHAPYAALLRDIHRRNPFSMSKDPYYLSSSSAANYDFLKKSQADFKDKRLVECGGEEYIHLTSLVHHLPPVSRYNLNSSQRDDMSVDDRELIESRDLLDVKDARATDISSTRTGSDVGDHPVPLPTSNASFTGAEYTLTGDEAAASNAASSPPSERSPDPLPSSIHPDFSVQTSNDFLLVTDDDVGFYVNRDFLVEHSDFFRDFEEMESDIRQDDDAVKGRTQAVRRDMPGALSNGLRVVLLKVKETLSWPDGYDTKRKVFRSQHFWEYDQEDLALAFRIANQYGFARFSAQARLSTPKMSPWFQYLYAAFEADETVAKDIAKSTLLWDLTELCPQRLFPVLDKHHAPYAALLRDIHRRSPFSLYKKPYSLLSSSAANHDFLKKSQADFKDKRLVECGGEEY
ncbi:hypothetical protein B9479_005165 [Cryptococcus floricola]|uniref:Uncharacterized protein n=1 Tax=Cryptococcus floricola TaxID=2591691 RepID=A0A5D3AU51_9TREE|nr:hypothetical protein B9479_005165 [Cryptococcus floricola]